MTTNRRWTSGMFATEDWWSVWIGLALFCAALLGSLWGASLMLRRRGGMQSLLPFGTLLAPAAMVVLLWGDAWLRAYAGFALGR